MLGGVKDLTKEASPFQGYTYRAENSGQLLGTSYS